MFARGSIPWFIAHDLKVSWRTWFQRKPRKPGRRRTIPVLAVVALIFALAALAIGVPVANAVRDTVFEATPIAAFIIDAALILVLTLMMSQTLVAAVDAFYDRGDLDLLLSSPIPPTRVLVMRAIAMTISPALLFGALVTPFVLPMAVLGHPEVLASYVVIASLALLSTAVGLAIAIGLFSSIGPRRTRTVAQVLAAVVGAAFIVVAQIPNFVGVGDEEGPTTGWFVDLLTAEEFPAIARWPAEALLGEPIPLLIFAVAGIGAFALVSIWVGRRFARDAAAASGADTVRRRKGRSVARFGASVGRSVMAKEWRLLMRDPGLISQLLLRVFYVIPVGVVIATDRELVSATGEGSPFVAAIAAGAAALLAGQLAGSVAWLALSAEEAPQLLASAPHRFRTFWRAKLAVALLIPAALIVPVMVLLAFLDPLAALVGLAAAAASAWSAAMINLWLQKPTKRSEFRRNWSATFGANALELLSSLSLAAFAGLLVGGMTTYALIGLAVAVAIIVLARRPEAVLLERITEGA